MLGTVNVGAMSWGRRKYTTHDNPYISERDGKWVITQKGTGKVLSEHETRSDAEASFRAMEANKHG
jgi:monomeric isocitrate dehydrogenase